MTVADEDLAARVAARARRAYEAGRLRWALTRAAAATAVVGVAVVACPERGPSAACAAASGLVLGLCLWRGGAWARGARLGFVAGLAPCLLPAAARAAQACDARICLAVPSLCFGAGAVAGALLGWHGMR